MIVNNCIIISFIANNDTDFILTSRDEDAHAILSWMYTGIQNLILGKKSLE